MVVIFCGELLQQAASLLNQGLHINDIITGYNKALDKTLTYLEGNPKIFLLNLTIS
jgi:chaperonin GroEL (HSP60 family)